MQNIITLLQGILRWAVPDVSGRLLKRIKRENFLLREHIIEYERQQVHVQTTTQLKAAEESNGLRQRQRESEDPNGTTTSFV